MARLQPSTRLLLLDFTARMITGVDKKVTGVLSRALAMEGKLARPLDERCQAQCKNPAALTWQCEANDCTPSVGKTLSAGHPTLVPFFLKDGILILRKNL